MQITDNHGRKCQRRGLRARSFAPLHRCALASGIAALCLLAVACTDRPVPIGTPVLQDGLSFPRSQFGKCPKAIPERLTSVAEKLLSGRDAHFEPLAGYAESSSLRRTARAVGLLDIQVATSTATCTASIIASDMLLTNHHCIPGDGDTIERVAFVPDYYDETGSSGESVG